MVRVELVGIRAHTSQMTGVGVGRSLATKVHIQDAPLTTKFTMQKKATNYHNINVNRQERKQRAALGNPAPNGLSKSAYVKSTRAAWSIRHPHQPPIQQDKYPRTYKAPNFVSCPFPVPSKKNNRPHGHRPTSLGPQLTAASTTEQTRQPPQLPSKSLMKNGLKTE